MLRLCCCLRTLLRIRRSADFVFGINIFYKRAVNLIKWGKMSMLKTGRFQACAGQIASVGGNLGRRWRKIESDLTLTSPIRMGEGFRSRLV